MLKAAGIPLLPSAEVPAETLERIRILKGLLAISRKRVIRAIHCGDLERVRGAFLEFYVGEIQFVKWKELARLVAEFECTGRKPAGIETMEMGTRKVRVK